MLGSIPAGATANPGPRWQLDLGDYQRADGAITVQPHGDDVDPYFALKALLLPQAYGGDASTPLRRFAQWLQPRQRADGGFDRYAIDARGWHRSRGADADDVLAALWIQAALSLATGRALGADERSGIERAESLLQQRLLDRRLGLYRTFPTGGEALLMDNVEVFQALDRIGALYAARGSAAEAAAWRSRAASLRSAIERHFAGIATLSPRTEAGSDAAAPTPTPTPAPAPAPQRFYPEVVAAPFAWLHGVPQRRSPARFDAWYALHADDWRNAADVDYPWGILAVAALNDGRPAIAQRWRDNAQDARAAGRWNVLEESAWQIVGAATAGANP